jgi:hypothetical protein
MTEAEWLACSAAEYPDFTRDAMLDELSGKASIRKLRFFACACCRCIWDLLTDERSRAAIEVAEQHADGDATDKELAKAMRAAQRAVARAKGAVARVAAWAPYWASTSVQTAVEAISLAGQTAMQVMNVFRGDWKTPAKHQCVLLLDIFRNPFQPSPSVDPSWLTWNSGTVPRMARAMYDERSFDLPILADALEDAGCADSEILLHCRGPGPHVRGCWVLDLVLGK